MKDTMISGMLVLLFTIVALNVWMYLQQSGMIFFPSRTHVQTPAAWGMEYEDVYLSSADGLGLHGWFIPQRDAKQMVLFFHGNAGNISHRGDSVAIFHRLGMNVLIIDYRGYGKSEGTPTEKGLALDADAAWGYLTQTKGFKKDDIVIFGRSLGGSVATRLAAKVQPKALILESTFSSARDMADVVLPLLSRAVFLRYHFNAAANIKQVTCPVLVIHSPNDEIIPFQLGEKVYQAANTPKFFLKIRGDHNNGFIQSQPGYERNLGKFISNLEL